MLDSNGGMQKSGGVTLVSDLSDLSDKLVRHGIPHGFACRGVVWLGSRVTAGGAGLLDSNGGVQKSGGVALVSDLSDLSDLSDKLVRHGIPRGSALPLCGMARAKMYRRGCGLA